MKKILLSLVVIVAVAAVAGGATYALFSDTETSDGNTLSAGTLDLQVGDDDPTTWTFSVTDFAPGDNYNHDVAISNEGNIDGDASIDVNISNSDEGVTPEAETEVDLTKGELENEVKICFYIREDSAGGFSNIACGMATDLDGTTIDIPSTYDGWINDDSTATKLRVRTWFVDGLNNNDAMGDSFDLDMTFNMVQN